MTLEAKVMILDPVIGDVGTILDSSVAASGSTSVTNVQLMQPTTRWRTTTPGAAFFEIDFGTDYAVDTVALLHTNATSAATVKISMDSTQAGLTSSPDFETTTLSHWPEYDDNGTPTQVPITGWERTHAVVHFTSTTKRYLRVDVNDSTNADDYYEIGRLFISNLYQPTINVAYGSNLPWPMEDKVKIESVGGAIHPISRPKIKRTRAAFQFKYEDEVMEELYELARLYGSSKDLLFCHDPTSKWMHHWLLHGTMSAPSTNNIPEYNYYTVNFTMEELI